MGGWVETYWHPAGVWGLMYWLSMEPFYQVIFSGLTREICRRAEARQLGKIQTNKGGGPGGLP